MKAFWKEIDSFIIVTILAFSLVSCKTAEQIQREKMVDQMNLQMVDQQKMSADVTVRIQTIEQRLGMITGQIEEADHSTKVSQETTNKKMTSELALLKESIDSLLKKNDENEKRISLLTTEINEQRGFVEKIVKSLKKIDDDTKVSTLNPYDQAMSDFDKQRYKSALPALQDLLGNSKKYTGDKQAKILHHLGVISFTRKNYDDALVYFSRLFTEHPSSGFNKSGLLQLGKSFQAKNEKTKATQTWQQLIAKWPKSNSAVEAQSLLDSTK